MMRFLSRIIACTSILGAALFFFEPGTSVAFAAGTPAGTVISNQATVYFSMSGGGRLSTDSNIVRTLIDEVIRANVTWQDAAAVKVVPGETNQYLSLTLTNDGNGTETFTLTVDGTLTRDQFDPTPVGVFLDSNYNGRYDPDDPPLGEAIELAAGQAVNIFIVNDIPENRSNGTPLQDKDLGLIEVSINNSRGTGPSGTVFTGDGDGGGTAIFGHAFPLNSRGGYIVKAIYVDITKTSTIEDQFGGDQPYPGATVTYVMEISATGSGTAVGLVFSDLIPANTTYKPDSLTLDGETLTDVADEDVGEVSGVPANEVTVRLGDQQEANRTITFDVTID